MNCPWCLNTCKHTFHDDTEWICPQCLVRWDGRGMIKIWNDNKSKWENIPIGCLLVRGEL